MAQVDRSRLTVNQLEDVVEDEVLARTLAGQLEGLGVVHRTLLLINLDFSLDSARLYGVCTLATHQESASYEDDDAAFVHGRLGIKGGHLVLDLLERQSLDSSC